MKIQMLESSVESFFSRESKMKHLIRSLEQEKASYQKTIERMRSSLPSDAMAEMEMTQLKSSTNGKAKESAYKKPWITILLTDVSYRYISRELACFFLFCVPIMLHLWWPN